ncbi:DNA-processing protein DprA [Devosia sp.]|uniref:DNA-processing protein DprA n=1 Tax=Devosia sp. TaxID=1871048 RepID=UPI003264F708
MPARFGETSLTRPQKIAWLRLLRTENVGPVTFRQLLNRFGSADAALEALPGLTRRTGANPRITTRTEAEDELAGLEKYGARLVATGEPDYPDLLNHIPASPPLLTIAGGENLDWNRTVGIVGARNASSAGVKMTRTLALDLGEKGYTVVSGLARGIDTAAHRASLTTGTIAVLAGGFDKIYPDENIPLAHEILDNGGALITEMPLGWEPRARDFPRRNRLVSGLSLGIVVVEAARRSGSLITARLALEQNRDVFAVPGSPLDPRAEGGNALIQQGARLITCADDIIETLSVADPSRSALFDTDWEPDFAPDESLPPSGDDRANLLSALSTTPVEVDEIVKQSGLPAGTIQMLLLELDLAGRIEWSSGQLVALRHS